MIELVRADRSLAQLSCEFGVTAQSIINWIGQATIDEDAPYLVRRRDRLRMGRIGALRSEVAPGSDVARHPGKATAWFARLPLYEIREVFGLVMANQTDLPKRTMCRVLGVFASGK